MFCRWCHFPSTTDYYRKRGQHIRCNRFAMWFSCAPIIIFPGPRRLALAHGSLLYGTKTWSYFCMCIRVDQLPLLYEFIYPFLRIAGFPSLKVGWVNMPPPEDLSTLFAEADKANPLVGVELQREWNWKICNEGINTMGTTKCQRFRQTSHQK